jgi:hypothetical protein
MKYVKLLIVLMTLPLCAQQPAKPREGGHVDENKFRQMYDLLATPNMFRTASGGPGPEYYQQRADYDIKLELDDKNTRLYGEETITYYNNAKEPLEFLWLQLDQNRRSQESLSPLASSESIQTAQGVSGFTSNYLQEKFDGGFKIEYVKDAKGNPLPYTVNFTMMRIDLPTPLKHKEKISFSIKWWYNINNYRVVGGRSGYEHFEKDGNNLYVLAQFYPRMAVYNDVEGWQNMQFWGSGEFALPFGNFNVHITVPADHFLDATGELQNRKEVYTVEQLKRYELATKTYDKPVLIVTQDEAEKAEKGFSDKKKTWKFRAENVRDFGIATSRKFICDAMAVKLGDKSVMAVSLYPKEGNPLWEEYSTRVVAHTLKTYSKYTFDYPYPKAISVNAEDQGMEYPMICWNYGRPDADGTYPDRIKYGMMGVIIHEVGHNFFPMIVNSDERQWTWMDEGLNSFLEYLTKKEWGSDFPISRGAPKNIAQYMAGDQSRLEPIMTNSETIKQFGNNAYAKPAAGLVILRETIMGPELFDYAFKTYANRWKFKHPTPEDFFRTMEDASAVDLDFFWRGWFYTTDYNDIGVKDVKQFYVSADGPKPTETPQDSPRRRARPMGPMVYMLEGDHSALKAENKKALDIASIQPLEEYLHKTFTAEERAKLKTPKYFYQVNFEKPGGLVMPLIVELTFEDGTTEMHKFPPQIWRMNDKEVSRTFATQKQVVKVTVDPREETADIDMSNNTWPREQQKSKFD